MQEYIALGILVIALGALMRPFSLKGRRLQTTDYRLPLFKIIFIVSAVVVFGFSLFFSVAQYFVWKHGGPPSIYFLPPYEPWSYVIQYDSIHYWFNYVISFLVALVFICLTKILNKKFDSRFFYPEELYMGALAVFLVGQPGWILYFIFLFFVTIPLAGVFSFVFKRRLSFYHLWLPLGIITLLLAKMSIVQSLWRIIG